MKCGLEVAFVGNDISVEKARLAVVLRSVTTFIWFTPTYVLAIVEQIDDRFDENLVNVILWHLVKRGIWKSGSAGNIAESTAIR